MENQFDVIVAGAGISGLLIASELSKSFSVLVIDSKDEIESNKFWVTLKSCVDINPHLKNYVDSTFDQMAFSDAYQNTYMLKGEYVLWDVEGLLSYLKGTILENNGQIQFSKRFCGYRLEKEHINIFANDDCYSSKLFIDCMGYGSPLVLAKDMIRIKGYYLLYGSKVKLKENIDPICLSNMILEKAPTYFELFPTSKKEAYAVMIYPTQSIKDMQSLEKDFDFVLKKSRYSKHFTQNNIISKLWGIVPVGTINKKALDKIFFWGESAQSNPAATGTCLTRLLLNYKTVSEFLIEKINNGDLSKKALSKAPVILNKFARNLQLYAFQEILTWNSDRYAKFISMIDHVDHALINKFLFGDPALKDVMKLRHLIGILKKGKFFLLKPFIRSISSSI